VRRDTSPGRDAESSRNDRDEPLITCAMVTAQRLHLALNSLRCFSNQSYPHRELLIICDSEHGKAQLSAAADALQIARYRVMVLDPGKYTLGALRNVALVEADGAYICQWDDDDLCHPDRLRMQFDAIARADAQASFLTEHLQLFLKPGTLFWCDWLRPRRHNWPPVLPGTVMCRTSLTARYPEHGAEGQRSEDLAFMKTLLRDEHVALLPSCGWLYIYVTHDANTWDRGHHTMIPRIAGLSQEQLWARRSELLSALTGYELSGPVTVADYLGRPCFSATVAH
jgi:glycosyltransferase involved in cell wall biosynthesis